MLVSLLTDASHRLTLKMMGAKRCIHQESSAFTPHFAQLFCEFWDKHGKITTPSSLHLSRQELPVSHKSDTTSHGCSIIDLKSRSNHVEQPSC